MATTSTTAQYIEELLSEEEIGVNKIPITKFVIWFDMTLKVNEAFPKNDRLVVIAIFRGLGEWRIYCMPREETKDPKLSDSPVRIILSQIAPTSDASAVPLGLFREMLKNEFRALAATGGDGDEDDIEPVECLSCGAEMPATFDFCGECGTRLPVDATVKCESCGEESPETASFCADCGKELPDEEDDAKSEKPKPAVTQ